MSPPRQIKLGMSLRPAGHHVAGWRHPDAWPDGGLNFPKYVEMARTAERGLFDLSFSADALTCPCRKLTLGYIGGAVRPKLARPTCDRRSGRRGGSVHPCIVTSVCELRCNIFDMS